MEIKAPTVIKIEGYDVALGLHWEDLTAQQQSAARNELKVLAKQHAIRFGLVCDAGIRRYVGAMYRTSASARLGKQYSAAVWMASALQEPVIVTGEIEDNLYWVGVFDDGVWIGGDTVGDNMQAGAAIAAAFEHFERRGIREPDFRLVTTRPDGSPCKNFPYPPRLSELYPDHNEIPKRTWAGILPGEPPKEALIRQLSGIDPTVVRFALAVGAVAAVSLVGAVGWMQYQRMAEEARIAEEMATQAAAAEATQEGIEAERARRKAQAIKEALDLYTATAEPGEVLAHCADFAMGLGGQVASWPVVELTCEPTVLRGQWRAPNSLRVTGLAEYALRSLQAANPPPSAVRLGTPGTEVQADWALTPPASRPAMTVEAITPFEQLHRVLVARSQLLSASFPRPPGWIFAEPVPASIVYVDPALDNEPENPARFVQVPPSEGFREASLTATGQGLQRLRSLPLRINEMTIKRVVIRPMAGSGNATTQMNWTVEASYVVR